MTRRGADKALSPDEMMRRSKERAKSAEKAAFRLQESKAADAAHALEMRQAASRVWAATVPISGTLGERYFASRAIAGPLPDELRFMPELEHWPSGRMLPAFVARVTAVDGAFLGVHLTFLTSDGFANKSLGDKRKLMLGQIKRGAVHFAEPVPGKPLFVGEGIETCLSAMQARPFPTWAALSTSGLRSVVLPDNIRTGIVILADGDHAGEAAARDCAQRWKLEGRKVRIARPPQGLDFNDMLMAGALRAKRSER
jgi:putative DNA primase/helicase